MKPSKGSDAGNIRKERNFFAVHAHNRRNAGAMNMDKPEKEKIILKKNIESELNESEEGFYYYENEEE